jgi:hypothetical protein
MKPYFLPEEQPLSGARHDRAIRRGIPALLALLSICVAGYFWQGVVHHIWGWSLVGLAISAAFAFGLWHAVVSGHVRTNHGEFYRHLRPFAFWLTVVICFALYLVSVATMFVAQPFATR